MDPNNARERDHAQRMEALGRMAHGVAHDSLNDLSVVLAHCEFLLEDLSADDPSRESVVEIRRAARNMSEINRQLQAFAGQQVLRPEVLDINATVLSTETMLRRLLGEPVRVVHALEAELWAVTADPHQVEQVLVNLAVHARDQMPDGGELRLETRNTELHGVRSVQILVGDSGPSLSMAELTRLFEPFSARAEGPDRGLGLATAFGILAQSGGSLTATSGPEGTCLVATLPVSDGQVEPVESEPLADAGHRHVLVVEDEDGVRRVVKSMLRRLGFTAESIGSAEGALELVEAGRPFDLVITDVVMPGMSGPELATELALCAPSLPVLYMSGYTGSALRDRGLEGKVIVRKPLSSMALNRAIRKVLAD